MRRSSSKVVEVQCPYFLGILGIFSSCKCSFLYVSQSEQSSFEILPSDLLIPPGDNKHSTFIMRNKDLSELQIHRHSMIKVKEESEKVGLKLNIQKTKIMASGPITSWEIDGETVETGSDFILGGSKITADSDFSHEIKRRLLLGRKVMINLDSRDSALPTKVRLVKAMVFPVVMYGCESWTVKKAEC